MRGQHQEGRCHRQRDHCKEDRLHPQREQPDAEREKRRQRQADHKTGGDRGPAWSHGIERDGDRVAADAVEHRVGERHRAGVAEQQVVGGDKGRENADLAGDVQRFRAGKQEGRGSQHRDDENEQGAEHAATRRIAGQDHHRLVTA